MAKRDKIHVTTVGEFIDDILQNLRVTSSKGILSMNDIRKMKMKFYTSPLHKGGSIAGVYLSTNEKYLCVDIE